MARSRVIKLACVVGFVCMVMVMLVLVPHAEAAITCNEVVRDLTPCITYVAGGGAVPADCCGGVRTLYNSARSTPDRQAVCQCLQQALRGISYNGYNLALAAGLPGKCGVNIPYKISPSTDCKSVK